MADAVSNTNGAQPESSRDPSANGRSGPRNFQKRGFGGRGRGNSRGKKRDMGRSEWSKQKPDKRSANNEAQSNKRRKLDDGSDAPLPIYATKFDAEEIQNEERRPKKKVAVMIGYSGTGYKGMQLAHDQKTIEGDLFKAFVAAGAISKVNADDPKKSSFVRCARTDKGVHAAGNIISLKLIIEDEDIVKKINDNLVPQIRVWGYERTNNSFSAYQLCDSRIYEYLIPTHSFLPPHPRSFLGRKCREWAENKDDLEQWEKRQEEVKDYWQKVDEEIIKPILEEYDEPVRNVLQKALWLTAERQANRQGGEGDQTSKAKDEDDFSELDEEEDDNGKNIQAGDEIDKPSDQVSQNHLTATETVPSAGDTMHPDRQTRMNPPSTTAPQAAPKPTSNLTEEQRLARRERHKMISDGVKKLRAAYISARRSYRLPEQRRERLQSTLSLYLGTKNYWNYTVAKTHRDPSAKRVIKSFVVNPEPIIIDGTEWLSLKVHGQSFMMHQIRKMVGMASLIVRCGCDPTRILESYGPANMSIPKAPSLGLLLERPIFESYNKRAKAELDKELIGFDKYEQEMNDFKQKFIYERMYHDEEEQNVFGNFFNHVDNFPADTFLFVTSGGLEASGESADGDQHGGHDVKANNRKRMVVEADLDSDDEVKVKDGAGEEG